MRAREQAIKNMVKLMSVTVEYIPYGKEER